MEASQTNNVTRLPGSGNAPTRTPPVNYEAEQALLGAVLANMKLDNMGEGVNLVFRLKNGKDVKFIANQYERHAELIELVSKSVRVPRETITMGVLSWKWPERA